MFKAEWQLLSVTLLPIVLSAVASSWWLFRRIFRPKLPLSRWLNLARGARWVLWVAGTMAGLAWSVDGRLRYLDALQSTDRPGEKIHPAVMAFEGVNAVEWSLGFFVAPAAVLALILLIVSSGQRRITAGSRVRAAAALTSFGMLVGTLGCIAVHHRQLVLGFVNVSSQPYDRAKRILERLDAAAQTLSDGRHAVLFATGMTLVIVAAIWWRQRSHSPENGGVPTGPAVAMLAAGLLAFGITRPLAYDAAHPVRPTPRSPANALTFSGPSPLDCRKGETAPSAVITVEISMRDGSAKPLMSVDGRPPLELEDTVALLKRALELSRSFRPHDPPASVIAIAATPEVPAAAVQALLPSAQALGLTKVQILGWRSDPLKAKTIDMTRHEICSVPLTMPNAPTSWGDVAAASLVASRLQ